ALPVTSATDPLPARAATSHPLTSSSCRERCTNTGAIPPGRSGDPRYRASTLLKAGGPDRAAPRHGLTAVVRAVCQYGAAGLGEHAMDVGRIRSVQRARWLAVHQEARDVGGDT